MKAYFGLTLLLAFLFSQTTFGTDDVLAPPYEDIKDNRIYQLKPKKCWNYDEFSKKDLESLKECSAYWSSIWKDVTSDDFLWHIRLSSSLKGHSINELFDNNIYTYWSENVEGDGEKEWIMIKFAIGLSNEQSVELKGVKYCDTAENITFSIGIIPGNLESSDTWKEYNRIKTAKLIIGFWENNKTEFFVGKLKFKDDPSLQVFDIPIKFERPSDKVIRRIIWLVIDDVYKGTKNENTCISEIVFREGNSL